MTATERIVITDPRELRPGDRLADGFVVHKVEHDARLRGWLLYPYPGHGLAQFVSDLFFEIEGDLIVERVTKGPK